MMFYKHLFLFRKRYIYIYAFYSCSVIIICSLFSSFSISSFRPYREKRKKRKHRFYWSCLFSLSLSFPAENTSCFCIYIYINQKICECSRAVFSSPSSSLYWPNLEPTLFYYSDSSIPTYKNRVCIYTYKKKSSVVYIYIYKSIVRFYIQSFISHLSGYMFNKGK